ncbi:hypothetical protein NC652_024255 [Populus alba x Populus x berolinensis]|nr:hypothetical protein NC652_024255 [Populus alba x Populus x berolinensis]
MIRCRIGVTGDASVESIPFQVSFVSGLRKMKTREIWTSSTKKKLAKATMIPQSQWRDWLSFLLYLSICGRRWRNHVPLRVSPGFDYKQCVGLKVKPRQGDGLLFYSLFPNGTIDRHLFTEAVQSSKG